MSAHMFCVCLDLFIHPTHITSHSLRSHWWVRCYDGTQRRVLSSRFLHSISFKYKEWKTKSNNGGYLSVHMFGNLGSNVDFRSSSNKPQSPFLMSSWCPVLCILALSSSADFLPGLTSAYWAFLKNGDFWRARTMSLSFSTGSTIA